MAITSTASPSLPGGSGACTGLTVSPPPRPSCASGTRELRLRHLRVAPPGRSVRTGGATRRYRRRNSAVPEAQLGRRRGSWGAAVLGLGLAGGLAEGGLEPLRVAGLPRPVGARPLEDAVDEPDHVDLVGGHAD